MAIAIVSGLGVAIFTIQMVLVAYIIAHELHVNMHFSKFSLLHHHHPHDEHRLHG